MSLTMQAKNSSILSKDVIYDKQKMSRETSDIAYEKQASLFGLIWRMLWPKSSQHAVENSTKQPKSIKLFCKEVLVSWQKIYHNLNFFWQKTIYVGYAGCIFLLLYELSGRYYLGSVYAMPLTWLDNYIPLMAWTFWIYVSDYLFLPLAGILAPTKEHFRKFRLAFWLILWIHIAIFLFFPTKVPYYEVHGQGITESMARLVHSVDVPCNAFPSLHVSMSVLSALVLSTFYRRYCWFMLLWGIAIIFSTLTTKQHSCYDVLGGFIVGMAVFIVAYYNSSVETTT